MFDGDFTRHSGRALLRLALGLACALVPALAFGQPFVAGNYALSSGGTSADSQYSISGAIGQNDAGPSILVGGGFLETGGFWSFSIASAPPLGRTPSVLTWTNPAPILYGTALDSNQLNAMANVPGDFAYTPSSGAVLDAGTNILSVIFTPSNAVSYTGATNTVSLVVSPAALTVTASNSSRLVGTTNPAFTDLVTGLANGDNITVTNSCSAGIGSPAGFYPIVPALVDPDNRQTNYIVNLVDGTLTVANSVETGGSGLIITNSAPVVAVTSPANNYLSTNPVVTVLGTVTGVGATLPLIAVNTNSPASAVLVKQKNGTINWSFRFSLQPGPNAFTAQAVSTNAVATNASYPVIRTFFYDVTPASTKKMATLALMTNGLGKISGQTGKPRLEMGKLFGATAVPSSGWVFAYWSSGTNATNLTPLSTNAALTFDMATNLILQANFTNNPFTNAAGVYNGLFYPAAGVTAQSSGFFTATLPAAGTGAFTANLALGGGRYPFSGSFNLSGDAQATLTANKIPLTVYLHLNLRPPDDQMSGYVFDSSSNGWTSELLADRVIFNSKTAPATNYAGNYTLAIPPGDGAPASEPGGYGYVTLANTLAGVVGISGSLADKTAISQSVTVSKDGNVPLYASLYSKQGLLMGWLTLTNPAAGRPAQMIVGSNLTWIKAAVPKTLYPSGFTNTNVSMLGSLYTTNFALTNGTLTISNGDLAESLTYSNLRIAGGKLITNGTPTNKLTGVIAPKTGILTITFQPTGSHAAVTATGVVLTDTNLSTNAAGWFTGTNQSGYFLLQP